MMKHLFYSTLKISLFCVIFSTGYAFQSENSNPPAPGFNAQDSDPKAIAIADEVMEKMGGRKAWDQTRYFTWKFFGRRFHVWDKLTGNIRVESRGTVTLMNIHTRKGRAWKNGTEITHKDSLAKSLDGGYRAWINDSYWLVMPYKLKDSGVTLKYLREGNMQDGRKADVLQLTFSKVGVTPQNKYEVFVDKKSRLVEEWSFFSTADAEAPRFTMPWIEWKQHGKILLSANRGKRGHTDIAVFDELPDSVFSNPGTVDILSFPAAKLK